MKAVIRTYLYYILINTIEIKPSKIKIIFMFYSSVHLAARMVGPTDVLEQLMEFGAQFDVPNALGCTPLFEAMKLNNFRAASILIKQG